MGKLIDLTGRRFGRLVVVSLGKRGHDGKKRWDCVCDCGKRVLVRADSLKSGATTSCGCFRNEERSRRCKQRPMRIKHHMHDSRLYHIWCSMKQRVENPKSKEYKNYGERGIVICDDWRKSFEAFYEWATQNGYQDNLTIDRIDNNGNYNPENCRWISNKENCNNKRTCRYITIGQTTKTLKQWSEFYGINYSTVQTRIRRGWNEIKALTTPVKR